MSGYFYLTESSKRANFFVIGVQNRTDTLCGISPRETLIERQKIMKTQEDGRWEPRWSVDAVLMAVLAIVVIGGAAVVYHFFIDTDSQSVALDNGPAFPSAMIVENAGLNPMNTVVSHFKNWDSTYPEAQQKQYDALSHISDNVREFVSGTIDKDVSGGYPIISCKAYLAEGIAAALLVDAKPKIGWAYREDLASRVRLYFIFCDKQEIDSLDVVTERFNLTPVAVTDVVGEGLSSNSAK
jgi:hypothetical protein